MKKLWNKIDGYKTDIGFIAGGIYSILLSTTDIGSIVPQQIIWSALAMWTGVAVRDAIRKVE